MSNRKSKLKSETYYHVYNRGNTKERLFFSEYDFERFGNTIIRYLNEFPRIQIHVWSFLPNHFHFLLSEKAPSPDLKPTPSPDLHEDSCKTSPDSRQEESTQISHFMRKIQQSYAMFYNSRYGDTIKQGHKAPVFEGRFRAKEITDDDYLAKVAYYIRHNAIKHDIVDDISDWPWAGVTVTPDFPELDYGGLDPAFDAGFE